MSKSKDSLKFLATLALDVAFGGWCAKLVFQKLDNPTHSFDLSPIIFGGLTFVGSTLGNAIKFNVTSLASGCFTESPWAECFGQVAVNTVISYSMRNTVNSPAALFAFLTTCDAVKIAIRECLTDDVEHVTPLEESNEFVTTEL